jgi:hypothetical protein
MKTELFFLGERIRIACSARRRRLVALIYVGFAEMEKQP